MQVLLILLVAAPWACAFSPPSIVSDPEDGSISFEATALFATQNGQDGGGRCRIDTLCTTLQGVKSAQENVPSTVQEIVAAAIQESVAAMETRLGSRLDALESRVAKLEDHPLEHKSIWQRDVDPSSPENSPGGCGSVWRAPW